MILEYVTKDFFREIVFYKGLCTFLSIKNKMSEQLKIQMGNTKSNVR